MKKLIVFIVIFAVSAFLAYLMVGKDKCGDGVCGKGEQCCEDCGCGFGEACSQNKCEKPVCGDSICSDNEECCKDCPCKAGTYCTTEGCLPQRKAVCGNGFCDTSEGDSCCTDCGCSEDTLVCSQKTHVCVSRGNANLCGDGLCDYGESVRACCEDCAYCEKGEYCDKSTHTCKVELSLSKEDAIRQAKLYLLKIGENSDWVSDNVWVASPEPFEGEAVMRVCNSADEGNMGEAVCVRINEDKQVIGVVRFH